MATEQSLGSVKALKGEAFILRATDKIPAETGMMVFQQDVIQTSKASSVGIIFRDNSIISVGPESVLTLSNYVFEPKNQKFPVLMKMPKGTFVYISGAIGKLSPDSIKLETPSSIISVRGIKMLISSDRKFFILKIAWYIAILK
jgi:hypothetical protein